MASDPNWRSRPRGPPDYLASRILSSLRASDFDDVWMPAPAAPAFPVIRAPAPVPRARALMPAPAFGAADAASDEPGAPAVRIPVGRLVQNEIATLHVNSITKPLLTCYEAYNVKKHPLDLTTDELKYLARLNDISVYGVGSVKPATRIELCNRLFLAGVVSILDDVGGIPVARDLPDPGFSEFVPRIRIILDAEDVKGRFREVPVERTLPIVLNAKTVRQQKIVYQGKKCRSRRRSKRMNKK